ncbi:Hypothetical predicted protein [Octopus vulgaris]|uniref:Uncharacterized protein n=1 Tax=Octopus vulgaris TaxID=6645 RepID=A0AA36B3P6_OCTVU|nr:Hypothetical predicted protein [Octopus vulgaris]
MVSGGSIGGSVGGVGGGQFRKCCGYGCSVSDDSSMCGVESRGSVAVIVVVIEGGDGVYVEMRVLMDVFAVVVGETCLGLRNSLLMEIVIKCLYSDKSFHIGIVRINRCGSNGSGKDSLTNDENGVWFPDVSC